MNTPANRVEDRGQVGKLQTISKSEKETAGGAAAAAAHPKRQESTKAESPEKQQNQGDGG